MQPCFDCACCGERFPKRRHPDLWDGRLDDYCYDCASARCDAYPGDCGKPRAVAASASKDAP